MQGLDLEYSKGLGTSTFQKALRHVYQADILVHLLNYIFIIYMCTRFSCARDVTFVCGTNREI